MFFRGAVIFGVLMVAGGCSGDDDAPTADTTTPVVAQSSTTSPAVSSTTTEAPTTTIATTTIAPTTIASTTTVATIAPALTFSDPPTEAELFALADAYWRTFNEASRIPDPEYPGLDVVIGEPLLSRTQVNLARLVESGEFADNPARPHVYELLYVEGAIAVTQECLVDDGRIVDSETGAVVDDSVVQFVFQLEMARHGSRWTVDNQYEVERVEGGSCDESG